MSVLTTDRSGHEMDGAEFAVGHAGDMRGKLCGRLCEGQAAEGQCCWSVHCGHGARGRAKDVATRCRNIDFFQNFHQELPEHQVARRLNDPIFVNYDRHWGIERAIRRLKGYLNVVLYDLHRQVRQRLMAKGVRHARCKSRSYPTRISGAVAARAGCCAPGHNHA